MRRLSIAFLFLFILVVVFMEVSTKRTYPVSYMFLIIPFSLAAYYSTIRFTFLLIILSLLFIPFYFIFGGNMKPLFFTLVGLISTPLAVTKFLKDNSAIKKDLEGRFTALKADYERLQKEETGLENIYKSEEEKVSDIAELYEITKEMSPSLEFTNIFWVLSKFLKGNFKFSECKLILVKEEDTTQSIDKIYKISGPLARRNIERTSQTDLVEMFLVPADQADAKLLNIFLKIKSPVAFPQDKARFDFGRVKARTVVAFPVISEERLAAILAVEDLPEENFERFIIVARQFALEIRKVKLYETVQALAIMDGLTGLFARRYFLERFDEELDRSKRQGLKFAFLMLDIDFFKNCNDRFGHLVGDVVLSMIGKLIKENVREVDLIGRFGGEEFSVILPDTDKTGGMQVAERIRGAVEKAIFRAYDETTNVSISIGVSAFPEDGKSVQELIDAADMAMYEAKRSGRNKVCAVGGETNA